jgi:hypothetical protein
LESTPASLEIKQAELRGLMEHLPLPLFTELLFDVFDRLEVIDLRSFGATCKSIRLIVGEHGGCWKRLVLWPSEKNYNRVADGESNVFDDVMGQLPDVKELIYAKNRTSKPKENVFYSSLFAIPSRMSKIGSFGLATKIHGTIADLVHEPFVRELPELEDPQNQFYLAIQTTKNPCCYSRGLRCCTTGDDHPNTAEENPSHQRVARRF